MMRSAEMVVSTCAVVLALALLAACAEREAEVAPRPARAGEAIDPVKTAAHLAAIRAAAAVGDEGAVREHMGAVQDDFRRSIMLADPARGLDRESARQAARRVDGVRSVAWIDRENLFVIVDTNQARTYTTIDNICLELESLGDTLGVVVNLQSGAASNGDELAVLSRNCQLEPGQSALLSRRRQIDVVDPAVRKQHQSNQVLSEQDAEDLARQEESLKVLEASTPSVHD